MQRDSIILKGILDRDAISLQGPTLLPDAPANNQRPVRGYPGQGSILDNTSMENGQAGAADIISASTTHNTHATHAVPTAHIVSTMHAVPSMHAGPTLQRFRSSCYLNCESHLDPSNIDLNRLGIVYEYAQYFYIVLEQPPSAHSARKLRQGFLNFDAVGRYLLAEWASLDRQSVGDVGIGAPAGTGMWPNYSPMIQEMRAASFQAGHDTWDSKDALEIEGHICSQQDVKRMLRVRLENAITEIYERWRLRDHERATKGQVFMDEFMVFGE